MKESIKKRIEAVRRGEVPEGYRIENGYLIPNDWKTVPLNRRFTRSTRKNKSGCENVLTISAQMGLVNQREFYDKDIASEDKSGYLLMKNGEFAYNKSYSTGYPYGVIKQLTKYDEGIVSPLYICFAPNAGTNTAFYTQYFEGGRYNREIYRVAQEGARNHGLLNVSVEDFFEGTLVEPSAYEQQKIAEILATCDRVIELKQRKIDELNKLKQVCLLEMFPKEGQAVPEIRFKGFTAPWEQRKLGDIGKARSGVGFPDADQGGVTGVPFFKVSDMNLDGNENEMIVANNYVTAEQIAEHRWSPITELPAIFFAKVGAAVMLNRKRLCRFPFLLDNNTMAYSLSPTKWDADFAKALFGTVDLTSLVQVGALPSYNAGDVESMGIYLPSLFEQEQIGAFFKLLDNLITLHQRELAEVGKYKKALMQLLLTWLVRVNA